jgi:hypothetical protein
MKCLITLINHTHIDLGFTIGEDITFYHLKRSVLNKVKRTEYTSICIEQDEPTIYNHDVTFVFDYVPSHIEFKKSEYSRTFYKFSLSFVPDEPYPDETDRYLCMETYGVESMDNVDKLHFELRLFDMPYESAQIRYSLFFDGTVKILTKPEVIFDDTSSFDQTSSYDETSSLLHRIEASLPSFQPGKLITAGIGTFMRHTYSFDYGTFVSSSGETYVPSSKSSCGCCSRCWLSVKNCFRRLFG